MASTYEDFAAGEEIKLERAYRVHGEGWGYEGVIRRIDTAKLPSGREIATEDVVMGCGHIHATGDEAKQCDGLPSKLASFL